MKLIQTIGIIATYALWWLAVTLVAIIITQTSTTQQYASHAPTHTSTPNIDATQNSRLDTLEAPRNMPTLASTATMQTSSTPPPTSTPRATVTPSPTLNDIFTTATTRAMTPTQQPTRNPIFATATALWLPTPTIDTFTATPQTTRIIITANAGIITRVQPSLSASRAPQGDWAVYLRSYEVMSVDERDGYTWYQIGNNVWVPTLPSWVRVQ